VITVVICGVTLLTPASHFVTEGIDETIAAVDRACPRTATVFADTETSAALLLLSPEHRGRVAFDTRTELLSSTQLISIATWLGAVKDGSRNSVDVMWSWSEHPTSVS
jgi:hypothetical protein